MLIFTSSPITDCPLASSFGLRPLTTIRTDFVRANVRTALIADSIKETRGNARIIKDIDPSSIFDMLSTSFKVFPIKPAAASIIIMTS